MQMNLANKLTLARVVMIPVFLVVLLTGIFPYPLNRYIATAIFVIASATDMLDGYIARSRNMVTNFGKFMDPIADKLLVASAMISLAGLGELSAVAVIIIISREFIVSGFRLIAVEAGIVIAASKWGKIKTITQMITLIFLLMGFGGTTAGIIGFVLVLLSVVLTIISGVDYIWKNKEVLKG